MVSAVIKRTAWKHDVSNFPSRTSRNSALQELDPVHHKLSNHHPPQKAKGLPSFTIHVHPTFIQLIHGVPVLDLVIWNGAIPSGHQRTRAPSPGEFGQCGGRVGWPEKFNCAKWSFVASYEVSNSYKL